MKEKDLVKLGFKKNDVSAEESGDRKFHYYSFDFFQNRPGISLLSCSNDELKNGEWFVTFLEENRIQFFDKKKLKKFIKVIKENIIEDYDTI